jgi:hypothetical protein
MMPYSPEVSEFVPSTSTTLSVAFLLVFLTSVAIALSFFSEESEVPTYPLNSTWLQRKRQFRINGAKVIEQGFVEVSLTLKTPVLTRLHKSQAASGVFRVVYLNGTAVSNLVRVLDA